MEDEVYKPKTVREKPWFSGCPSQMWGFPHSVFEVALSFCISAEKPDVMFKLGAPVFGANLDHFAA